MTDQELRDRFSMGEPLTRTSVRKTRKDDYEEAFTFGEDEVTRDQARRALKGIAMVRELEMHARMAKGGSMFVHRFTVAEKEPAPST